MPRDIIGGVLIVGVVRAVIDEGNHHVAPEAVDERHPRPCATTAREPARNVAFAPSAAVGV